ncbi:hypothetical protein [Macrococcoides caseolyticum]|uniref:hypothetical protein n=1 Tax=Macrococcoides caseolyticum TaxID=69966 RepID=UPI001F280E9A|nr:hypothetical protein [Macrococcus caseolyticus]MCE4955949.1 hypothetical protein [Macrococcus caseolyticus]
MPLKTLSLNKALFSNLSRSIIFLSLINIICTFILVPFSYVIAHTDSSARPHLHSKYLIGEMMTLPIYFFGTMAYALLCAAFLTYFFKSQAASDFMHSLPIKRQRIITTAYAVFFSHLLINLLLNGLITWIVGIKYASIDCEKIVIWILVNLVIDGFIFSVTMLFGLYINNMLNHIFSSIILIISPFILGTMIYTTHMFMFKGLQEYPDELMTNLTVPIRFLNDIINNDLDFKYLLMVFITSVIIFALLFVVYKRRKNERINEAYSTNYAHFIVFFISMLIATLLGGIIFNSIFNEQKLITVFIYLVTFSVVYILLEMIAQKSVRINFNRKLYLMTLGMIAIAIVGVYISGQMRENYIPKLEDVKHVKTTFDENEASPEEDILGNTSVDDQSFIQAVIDGHKTLINAERAHINDEEITMSINLSYHLKGGREIKRTYEINEQAYQQYMRKVSTEENARIITQNIDWNKIFRKNVTLNVETSDSSYADENLTNQQKDKLKQLMIDKYQNSYKNNDVIPLSNSSLHFTFTTDDNEGLESLLYISIYDKNIIDFLVDEKLIAKPSSALPLGDVYDLGNKENYKKIGDQEVDDLPFAKKINREKFTQLFNEYGADANGTHLYFFDGSYQYVLMNK